MLNLIGLLLSFIGTVITLFDIVFGKGADKDDIRWGELNEMKAKSRLNKKYAILGLSILAIGFLLQLFSAVQSIYC